MTAIDHVQLAMPAGREDDARRFYTGVLGMTEIPKPEALASRGGCWFQSGDVILHFGVEEPFVPAQKAHPGVRVSDLATAAGALEAAGHTVTFDDSIPGIQRFHTMDTFGNRLEFLAANNLAGNEMKYQVVYELNRNDLARGAAFHRSRRQLMPRESVVKFTIMVCVLLFLPFSYLIDNSKNQVVASIVLLASGTFSFAAGIGVCKRTDLGLICSSLSTNQTEREPTTFTIRERGIEWENGSDRGAWDWAGISFVAQTDEDIHIVSALGQSGIVPKRAFKSSLESEQAYALLRSYTAGALKCTSCGYDLTGNVTGRCPECNALA